MATAGVWRNLEPQGFSVDLRVVPNEKGAIAMKLSGVTTDRLAHRQQLLSSMDRLRRTMDATGQLEGLDSYTSQAFDVSTSSKLVDAERLRSPVDPARLRRQTVQFQYDGAAGQRTGFGGGDLSKSVFAVSHDLRSMGQSRG